MAWPSAGPALTRLTSLGGQLLIRARYRQALVARPDQAIGDQPARKRARTPGTRPPRVLLIHAQDDPLIALHHAQRLRASARAAGREVQAYFTPVLSTAAPMDMIRSGI